VRDLGTDVSRGKVDEISFRHRSVLRLRFVLLWKGRRSTIAAFACPRHPTTGEPIMETTIRVDNALTTLVNVFTTEPADQPKVLALLEEGVASLFSKMPGWISSNLHRSRDGKRIVVYSQWRNTQDIEAFRQDPRMKPYLERFGALAKHEAFTCDVSYVLHC
jgi:quinol monooxygenase YgiN